MRRGAVNLTVLLVIAVVVLPLGAVSATKPAQERAAGSGRPPVLAEIYEYLRSDYEIGITMPDQAATPAITEAQAVAVADGFGGEPESVHLVLYTDYANAPEEKRLEWLVVFREATVPILGPPGRGPPFESVQTVAAFVDAVSGEELDAVTLPR